MNLIDTKLFLEVQEHEQADFSIEQWAKSHGFDPVSADEATKNADVINILLPDEIQADPRVQAAYLGTAVDGA